VPLVLRKVGSGRASPNDEPRFVASTDDEKWVCGSGMPTVQGCVIIMLSKYDVGTDACLCVGYDVHWPGLMLALMDAIRYIGHRYEKYVVVFHVQE
jgi:hypothetical protein